MQRPAAWDAYYQAEREVARALNRERRNQRARSPVSMSSHRRMRHRRSTSMNALEGLSLSESAIRSTPAPQENSFTIFTPQSSGFSMRSTKDQTSASRSTFYSTTPLPSSRSVCGLPDWGSAVMLPSPDLGEYSSSELSTPRSDSQGIVTRHTSSIPSIFLHRNSSRPSFTSQPNWGPSERRGSF